MEFKDWWYIYLVVGILTFWCFVAEVKYRKNKAEMTRRRNRGK